MTEPDPDETLTELGIQLEAISAEVTQLGDSVDAINAYLLQIPGGPWDWATLDAEVRSKLWDQLYDFVAWLDDRYLQHLPREAHPLVANWWEHPVAVELLTALMVAHQAAYNATAQTASFTLVEWHELCLWPTLERIKALQLFKNAAQYRMPQIPAKPLPLDRSKFDQHIGKVPE